MATEENTTEWIFDDCRVVLKDGIFYCHIGDRVQTIVSDNIDKDVFELNCGYSPLDDAWEDGNGNKVCYDNALPYFKME